MYLSNISPYDWQSESTEQTHIAVISTGQSSCLLDHYTLEVRVWVKINDKWQERELNVD